MRSYSDLFWIDGFIDTGFVPCPIILCPPGLKIISPSFGNVRTQRLFTSVPVVSQFGSTGGRTILQEVSQYA